MIDDQNTRAVPHRQDWPPSRLVPVCVEAPTEGAIAAELRMWSGWRVPTRLPEWSIYLRNWGSRRSNWRFDPS